MPAYARAHVIKNHSFKMDGVDYSNQLQKVRFVPSQEVQTYKIAVPDGNVTDIDTPTWVLELGGIQDFGTGSLGKALRDLGVDGEAEVEYQPKAGIGQDLVTATIKGAAIPMGGSAGEVRQFDSTFGVVGEPVPSQSVA